VCILKLRLNVNTCSHGILGAACSQKRCSQFAAATATSRHTQLSLQIAHGGCTGGDGLFDVVVSNGVADADKHDVLQ
jgi:hypothetical protein